MSDKIYVGSGKKIDFTGGGSKISITLTLDGLKEYFEKYGFTAKKSGKKMLKFDVCERREPDEWENTHYVIVDTWKPDSPQSTSPEIGLEDDIPF